MCISSHVYGMYGMYTQVYRSADAGAGFSQADLDAMYAEEASAEAPVYRGLTGMAPGEGPPPLLAMQDQIFCADFMEEGGGDTAAVA